LNPSYINLGKILEHFVLLTAGFLRRVARGQYYRSCGKASAREGLGL
jgi:hypothetical protein